MVEIRSKRRAQAGTNQISITGLSSFTDAESFRVSGLGDARLLDVVCTIDQRAVQEEESQEVRDARRKIQDLRAEINIRNQEMDMLLQYGRAMGGTSIQPDQAIPFTEHVSGKRLATQLILNQLADKIEFLETFIKDNSVPKKGRVNGRATIVVSANEDGLVQLTVSYCTSIWI
jgi:hypothetical protein